MTKMLLFLDAKVFLSEKRNWIPEKADGAAEKEWKLTMHIWDCIQALLENANDTWKRQKIASPDMEYLKSCVRYASKNNIPYNKALVVKCLDDLTDWVLFFQYLESMETDKEEYRETDSAGAKKVNQKIGYGRTDFAVYTGLALRQASIETVDNKIIAEIGMNVDLMNCNFWQYAENLKNELIKLLLEIQIFTKLLESGQAEFGNKKALCNFFESL